MLRYICFILLFSNCLLAQEDMTPGFAMLEDGQFDEAKQFFSKVLENQPSDKTANICFGRAVGLAGDPVQALKVFKAAERQFPNDFELNLNIAEAYLWNKDTQSSLSLYIELSEIEPNNFTVCQGMANCHFKIGNYQDALLYIDKASVLDPNNKAVNESRKYIVLAFADSLAKEHQFLTAIEQLNELLVEHPNDEQVLINMAIYFIQLENYGKAKAALNLCLENDKASFEATILMSHLSMLMHKDKAAVMYADMAFSLVSKEDKSIYLRAAIQKLNALGAAKKFKLTTQILEELMLEFRDETTLEMASARLKVWDNQAIKGLSSYDNIDESSYDLYMGRAEAYIAINKYSSANEVLDSALVLRPESIDAIKLKNQVIQRRKPTLEINGSRSADKGMNEAKELGIKLNVLVKDKHNLHFRTGLRSTKNTLLGSAADQVSFFIGDKINISPRLSLGTYVGAILFKNEDANTNLTYISQADLNFQVSKNQLVSVSYGRTSLSYSSDLIESGLVDNRISLGYQYTQAKRPGFYLNSAKSFFSDGNESINVFSSIYYEINSFPIVKIGVNGNYLSFKEERPNLYFSPETYQTVESFIHIGNNYDQKSKLFYSAMFAYGLQKVNEQSIENTTRLDLQVGYRLTNKLQVIVSYYTNTAASSTDKGYSFNRLACKLNMSF